MYEKIRSAAERFFLASSFRAKAKITVLTLCMQLKKNECPLNRFYWIYLPFRYMFKGMPTYITSAHAELGLLLTFLELLKRKNRDFTFRERCAIAQQEKKKKKQMQ